MTRQEIRLKCAEITNRAAVRIGFDSGEVGKNKFFKVTEDVIAYVTKKNADTELRLKCAEMALSTVSKRGFANELLLKKIQQVEEFVLEDKADIPTAEDKAEAPKAESKPPKKNK